MAFLMDIKNLKSKITIKEIFLFVLFFVLLIVSCTEVIGRLFYELHEIANFDTGLYYTVGKGITHGIEPYSGLYENKPPMIFLLSALSYKITGGFYLVNIFSFLSFIVILVAPAACFFTLYAKEKSYKSFLTGCIALALSTVFMCYAENRSGEVQIEAFGAAALIISFCALTFIYNKDVKINDKYVIIAGIFLGIATMFKEPFSIVGVACFLYFVQKPRDFLTRIAAPLAYCSLFCLLILLISGCFTSYFTVYLANMFGNHITQLGSPFSRINNVFLLFHNLNNFSFSLNAAVICLIVFNAILCFLNNPFKGRFKQGLIPCLKIARLFLLIYAASFAVGMSGYYYNHHFIFALPCYIILLFSLNNEILLLKSTSDFSKETQNTLCYAVAFCFLILSSLYFFYQIEYRINYSVPNAIKQAKINAKYLDQVLDAVGEDKYLYLGFNGHEFYAYTEHLPIGPFFAQWNNNFQSKESFISKKFFEQLNKANVIIFRNYSVGNITDQVLYTVDNCFTKKMPKAVNQINKPQSFKYNLHIRKKSNCIIPK